MDLLENRKSNEDYKNHWEYISDKVMGGKSEGKLELISEDDAMFLRLSGLVSTENNGGFIQFRSTYNVSSDKFSGLKIKVKGKKSKYFIHIRTSRLFLPWQYYSAEFSVNENWQEVTIMFKDFKKSNFYQPRSFTPSEIKTIAFVAFGKNFEPKLDVLEAKLF